MDTRITLDQLEIASPCQVPWESMQGNDRVRFCNECQLNVYNLSGMARGEAEALINDRERRVCVSLLRRADGTVLTQDCPVGLRAIRRRLARMVAGVAAMLAFLTVGTISAWSGTSSKASSSGSGPLDRVAKWIEPTPVPEPPPCERLSGDMAPPNEQQNRVAPMMGKPKTTRASGNLIWSPPSPAGQRSTGK